MYLCLVGVVSLMWAEHLVYTDLCDEITAKYRKYSCLQLKAYGHPYSMLPWLSDLYVSLTHLMGRLCGYVLSSRPHPPFKGVEDKKEVEGKRRQNELIVNSEIWRTLFRGGCMVRKLTQSLSGAYVRN